MQFYFCEKAVLVLNWKGYGSGFYLLTSPAGTICDEFIMECVVYIIELSNHIEHCDVFFTIVMQMLVCHNCDSFSSFKDP